MSVAGTNEAQRRAQAGYEAMKKDFDLFDRRSIAQIGGKHGPISLHRPEVQRCHIEMSAHPR
jgi:hypothetical protein